MAHSLWAIGHFFRVTDDIVITMPKLLKHFQIYSIISSDEYRVEISIYDVIITQHDILKFEKQTRIAPQTCHFNINPLR